MNDPQLVYDDYSKDIYQDMHAFMPYLKEVGRGTVLEIGVRGGVSTAAFLLSEATEVFSVDIDVRCADLYKGHPKWTFIYSDSQDHVSVKSAIPDKLDVLFIDGLHSYEGLKSDLTNYHGLVVPGGLILVHDVSQHNAACVTQEQIKSGWAGQQTSRAFNEFLGKHREYRSQVLPGAFGLGVIYV